MDIEKKIFSSQILTERQKTILKLRALNKTLQEVGYEIGVSRERVRQIGETIKRKLRQGLTEEELKDYTRWYYASRRNVRKSP